MKIIRRNVLFIISLIVSIGLTAQDKNNSGTPDFLKKSRIELLGTVKNSRGDFENVIPINKSDISFRIDKEVEVKLIKKVSGKSSGYKIIPWMPILPKYFSGIIDVSASESEAEKKALDIAGGDVLLNKRVERTYKGFVLIWIEKIEVSGFAAEIVY